MVTSKLVGVFGFALSFGVFDMHEGRYLIQLWNSPDFMFGTRPKTQGFSMTEFVNQEGRSSGFMLPHHLNGIITVLVVAAHDLPCFFEGKHVVE